MPPKRDEAKLAAQLHDLKGITEELKKESDRGAIIVGAAYLDERLREYITAFLIRDAKAVNHIFGIDRPLSSFGARIQIAYCLGLLCTDEYHDFDVVRDIRNAFAHHLQGLSFTDGWVANRCNDFALPRKTITADVYQSYNSRELFMLVFSDLNASMITEQFYIDQRQERRVVPGQRNWRTYTTTEPSQDT